MANGTRKTNKGKKPAPKAEEPLSSADWEEKANKQVINQSK